MITTPAGGLRFVHGDIPHDTEIEYLYPAEFTTDLQDHSGAIFDAGMQDAQIEVEGVSIPYKIWNVFSPHKEVLPFFEYVSPKTQMARKVVVPGWQWNTRTQLITGEEHPGTLQERMSAIMVACMEHGMDKYTGEEVTSSVKEGQNRLGEFIHLQKWDIKNGMTHHMSWIPHFKDATVRCFAPAEIVYPQSET